MPIDVLRNLRPGATSILEDLNRHQTYRGQRVLRVEHEPETGDMLIEVEARRESMSEALRRRAPTDRPISEGDVHRGHTVVDGGPDAVAAAAALVQRTTASVRDMANAFRSLERASALFPTGVPADEQPTATEVSTYRGRDGLQHAAPAGMDPNNVPAPEVETNYLPATGEVRTHASVTLAQEMLALLIRSGRMDYDFDRGVGTFSGCEILSMERMPGGPGVRWRVTYLAGVHTPQGRDRPRNTHDAGQRAASTPLEEAQRVGQALMEAHEADRKVAKLAPRRPRRVHFTPED